MDDEAEFLISRSGFRDIGADDANGDVMAFCVEGEGDGLAFCSVLIMRKRDESLSSREIGEKGGGGEATAKNAEVHRGKERLSVA